MGSHRSLPELPPQEVQALPLKDLDDVLKDTTDGRNVERLATLPGSIQGAASLVLERYKHGAPLHNVIEEEV